MCRRAVVAKGEICQVEQCGCGTLHVSLGAVTLRLAPEVVADAAETLSRAMSTLSAPATSGPPPPHDPCERELAHVVGDWEVRVFADGKFEYFAPRGLWHVQLWHPKARVSVLTPSKLTGDAYEVFPAQRWKQRVASHASVAQLVAAEHSVTFVSEDALREIERVFVRAPMAFSTSSREAS